MKTSQLTMTLALALAATTAVAGQDGFQRLYGANKQEPAPAATTKQAAVERFGQYGPVRMTHRPSPVHSELRIRRLPDGRVVLTCDTVHHGEHGLPDVDIGNGRRER